jgi:hypothetical protein
VAKKRVLVFDFFIRPETQAQGDRYAEKIMRTFEPGTMLGPALEKPAPIAASKPVNPVTTDPPAN